MKNTIIGVGILLLLASIAFEMPFVFLGAICLMIYGFSKEGNE